MVDLSVVSHQVCCVSIGNENFVLHSVLLKVDETRRYMHLKNIYILSFTGNHKLVAYLVRKGV